ncbi:uncharacterized protein LOC116003905 [Ipomoea triloba]|uniref:uncharacterized protein LOC116003905 n=1 Tax=Ipomoea triloba TaxID=35885 RepID=UPI00125D3240|nr:uncharacterized protein LOC116003905 [Ipomoea triloba]
MPQGFNGSLVSGLIDPATNSWDQAILQDFFLPHDVERILTIPISPNYEDSWYWHGDPRGCYTVKQGYRRICGEFAIDPRAFDKWIPLWKIKSPPKWKAFLWRALTDVLPTTTNIILKRVGVHPSCPMCGLTHENTMHSLVLRDFSKLVWHEATISIPTLGENNFTDWFSNILSMLTAEDLVLAVATLYHIWLAHNSAVWKNCLPLPKSVWRSAYAVAMAWCSIHHDQNQQPTSLSPTVSPPALQPQALSPAAGYRCYFDAGYMEDTRRATIGAVLLSANGDFLAAFNGPLHGCLSPLMAESMACKEVLSWLKNRGFDHVALHTDCASLHRLLTTIHNELFSYVAFSIESSRAIMSSFTNCSISLVPRAANLGAHSLASLAYSQTGFLFWDSIPRDAIAALI